MHVKLLLLLVGVLVPTTVLTEILNQCPQGPEDSNSTTTYYGHPDNCRDYYVCVHGQPVLQTCGEGRSWSDVYSTCVGYASHFDTCMDAIAERECPKDPTQLIPHPTACQRYYNCSDTSDRVLSSFKKYEDECPNLQHFDVVEKKCKPHQNATCRGDNREAVESASSATLGNQCYHGWNFHEGSCYAYINVDMTWPEAQAFCISFSARLAEPKTATADSYVRTLAKRNNHYAVWLGATDAIDEGTWLWASTISEIHSHGSYTNWGDNEPTGGHDGNEHCLTLWRDIGYKWNDDHCDDKFPFICEHRSRVKVPDWSIVPICNHSSGRHKLPPRKSINMACGLLHPEDQSRLGLGNETQMQELGIHATLRASARMGLVFMDKFTSDVSWVSTGC